MPSADLTTIVRTLVAALPDACLRDLCLQLALGLAASPPTPSLAKPAADTHVQRRRGRPRKTAGNGRRRTEAPAKKVDPKLAERRKRYEANRKAKRHAAKAAEVAKASPSTPATGMARPHPSRRRRSGSAASRSSRPPPGTSRRGSSEFGTPSRSKPSAPGRCRRA
jgi:hypothetical protein